MATSKTLTPTNETIQIPAMTDAPDASVFSNCIDKEADAINALNSNITSRLNIQYDGTSTPTQKFENAPIGFSVVSVIQGKEGNPTSDGAWTIMQFKPDAYNQYGIQMAVQTNSSKLYLRRLYAGTWSSWTLIGGN